VYDIFHAQFIDNDIYYSAILKVPNVWSNWSDCTSQCEQKRYLKCHNHECDVEIIETRLCYDARECGMYKSFC
jgi:hypothetical protein